MSQKKSTTTGISEPRTSASKFALVNTASILFSPSIISCCIQSFSAAFAYRSGGHRKPLCHAYFFFLPLTTSFASSKHFLIRIIFRFSSILSQVACESHRFTHAHILIRHTAFPSFHVYYMQIFMTYHGGGQLTDRLALRGELRLVLCHNISLGHITVVKIKCMGCHLPACLRNGF